MNVEKYNECVKEFAEYFMGDLNSAQTFEDMLSNGGTESDRMIKGLAPLIRSIGFGEKVLGVDSVEHYCEEIILEALEQGFTKLQAIRSQEGNWLDGF